MSPNHNPICFVRTQEFEELDSRWPRVSYLDIYSMSKLPEPRLAQPHKSAYRQASIPTESSVQCSAYRASRAIIHACRTKSTEP